MKRSIAAAAMAALLVFVPSAFAVRDYARTALNIIPSGQYGGVPTPPEADRQARMYDGLTPLFDDVGRGDLLRFFKSERLGVKGQGRLGVERPRQGVRIIRDRHNVPHIYGRTDDDVTFGAGWALAQDRALLLEQARYNSRVAAIDAPGLEAIDLIVGLKQFQPSAQTEREVAKEARILRTRYGRRGRRFLHDIDVFVRGINAQYRESNSSAKPWTRNDVIALNAVKSELFGEGGGGEVRGRRVPRRPPGRPRRRARAVALERPAPAPGPGDPGVGEGQLPLLAAAASRAAATW